MGGNEPDKVACQFCGEVFEASDENGLAGDQHADHLTDDHQELLEHFLRGRVVV